MRNNKKIIIIFILLFKNSIVYGLDDKIEKKHSSKELSITHGYFNPSTEADNIHNLAIDIKETKSNFEVIKNVEDAIYASNIGHIEVATTIYQNIIKKYPKNIDALFGLAMIYHLNNQNDEARSLYTKLLQIDPNNESALNNFLILNASESPYETILELKKLEQDNPNMDLIPAQLSVIYSNLKNYSKAIQYMSKAIILSPENLTYRYNLAVIFDQAGEKYNAIKLYKQILNVSDNYEDYGLSYEIISKRLNYLMRQTD